MAFSALTRKNPKIIIVIINYNGLSDTIKCLESIERITYDNFEVILVDNGSKKDPIPFLKKKFKKIIFIRSKKNLGYTGGNNLGMRTACEYNPRYVFFLNNDTIVSTNILTELSRFLECNEKFGLIGPVNYYYRNINKISFYGGLLNRNNGLIKYLYKNCYIQNVKEKVVECNFVEGSAIFIRTCLLKRIGGFFDGYFLTSEESEMCLKVSEMGYKLAVINSCAIWHKVSQSMIKESELINYFTFRNKLLFVNRNANNMTCGDVLQLLKYYFGCMLLFGIKRRNYLAVKGIICGIYDFMLGVKGPGRYKNKLNA